MYIVYYSQQRKPAKQKGKRKLRAIRICGLCEWYCPSRQHDGWGVCTCEELELTFDEYVTKETDQTCEYFHNIANELQVLELEAKYGGSYELQQ